MASKTPKYELRRKEDNDFYDFDDLNENWDKVENALTEFDDSGSVDGITSFTEMLTKLVTGNKLAVTLRNLKAGLQFVLHTGSIVNNCVTDNARLPLSAAQGKALQDAIAKLNGDSHSLLKIKSKSGTINLGAWKSMDLRVPVTAPDGYTPIGLMSFDTAGTIPICINAMMMSTVEVTVGLTNTSADVANNTGFNLSALYIKSTFVC